jgi:hypothetical protein
VKLKIIWRNPVSFITTKRTLWRIRRDQFGAVYAVCATDLLTQQFVLIPGKVA